MKKLVTGMVVSAAIVAVGLASVSAPANAGDRDHDHDHDHDHDRPRDAGTPPPPPPPTTAHGTNVQIKSGLDNNYCVDIANGTNEGRGLTLSLCAASVSQRWAFTWNQNNTNSIVETQGMCVDIRNRVAGDGVAVGAYKCHHGDLQKFTFTPTGHIQEVKTGKCLTIPGASAGVAVSLDTCDETKKQQTFKLAQ